MYAISRKVIGTVLANDPSVAPEQREIIECILDGKGGPRKWITEGRAAELLGIDKPCLNRWRRSGKNKAGEAFCFTVIQTVANGIRYDEEDVLRYVEELVRRGCPKQEA